MSEYMKLQQSGTLRMLRYEAFRRLHSNVQEGHTYNRVKRKVETPKDNMEEGGYGHFVCVFRDISLGDIRDPELLSCHGSIR
jgi:hypothetical protein